MCQPARKKTCKPRRATPRPQPGDKVVAVRCQPATYPCPSCGRRGHRRHKYDRFVRSLAYGQVLWLHVSYAEYTARCDCRKYFRSCPPQLTPKAEYDNLVRQAVLNCVLDDGLNVQRTLARMTQHSYNRRLRVARGGRTKPIPPSSRIHGLPPGRPRRSSASFACLVSRAWRSPPASTSSSRRASAVPTSSRTVTARTARIPPRGR